MRLVRAGADRDRGAPPQPEAFYFLGSPLEDMQRRAESAEGMAREMADRVERERAKLDALHRQREAEIEEHVRLKAEMEARRPWWRRFVGRD